jgi:hypothetical protein
MASWLHIPCWDLISRHTSSVADGDDAGKQPHKGKFLFLLTSQCYDFKVVLTRKMEKTFKILTRNTVLCEKLIITLVFIKDSNFLPIIGEKIVCGI